MIADNTNSYELAEHAKINNVHGKKVFIVGSSGNVLEVNSYGGIATIEQETTPTDSSKNNPSYTVTRTYVAPTYTTVISKVINGVTYTKTIVKNTTTNVETISAWS